jgi:hypothetical protein
MLQLKSGHWRQTCPLDSRLQKTQHTVFPVVIKIILIAIRGDFNRGSHLAIGGFVKTNVDAATNVLKNTHVAGFFLVFV